MNCDKECSCNECEMLMINQPIIFIERRGLEEHRATLVGVKCMRYGVYSETIEGLKTSNQLDDFIYIN